MTSQAQFFADISVNFEYFFKSETFRTWKNMRPVVSRRSIWPLKYVPTRRNEWNFYALSTTKRRRTIETKNKLWKAPLGWAFRWCFCFIKHTVWPGPIGDRYGYLGAEKIMQIFGCTDRKIPGIVLYHKYDTHELFVSRVSHELFTIHPKKCMTIRCRQRITEVQYNLANSRNASYDPIDW